jgi:hypothetical protein
MKKAPRKTTNYDLRTHAQESFRLWVDARINRLVIGLFGYLIS